MVMTVMTMVMTVPRWLISSDSISVHKAIPGLSQSDTDYHNRKLVLDLAPYMDEESHVCHVSVAPRPALAAALMCTKTWYMVSFPPMMAQLREIMCLDECAPEHTAYIRCRCCAHNAVHTVLYVGLPRR